ncbi:UbiA family prenyltransferase [Nocardia africana]|uniref:UbiA family prenyltransferase n=1 Tax=Nocardia africana TaxID=134964 RepID=A0ABW6NU11_9NOCA
MSLTDLQQQHPGGVAPRSLRTVRDELRLCWLFTRDDLTATVVPATIFGIAASVHTSHGFSQLTGVVVKCLIYFWLYIYTFNLSNQLTGIDEDRLNKPHRPLVRGEITAQGTRVRLVVATVVFFGVGVLLGVASWTAVWLAAWVFHDHRGGAARWWGKNAAMVAGTVAQLAAAWQITAPLDHQAWLWILVIAAPLGVLVSVQDLRDVAGDVAVGRRTAVVVFGDRRLRAVLTALFAIYPFVLYPLLYHRAPLIAASLGSAAAALLWVIAIRVAACRNPKSDNITYTLYTCWYCLTLLSAVFALAH